MTSKLDPEALEALIVELRCGDPSGAKCDKASDMLIEICRALRTGQLVPAQPSGDEVEGRVIADVVKWLRTGGHLQQRCSIQSACVLSNAATALETGEWRNAQSV